MQSPQPKTAAMREAPRPMTRSSILEICVETLDAALAAERGGANRLELCEELSVGGVTPRIALLRAIRSATSIPIHSMIRPRGGGFCYSAEEFQLMKDQVRIAQNEGMNGVALGILTASGEIDFERTAELVEIAKPLSVTFHRAFDETTNLDTALEAVIATGAARILSSGGPADAVAGTARLTDLVLSAGERVIVMPGGGIRPENLGAIAQVTGAAEFHSGLSHLRQNGHLNLAQFESAVRDLSQTLR
jgi:copper homeostasis protein